MSIRPVNGSTVHAGGYACECFECASGGERESSPNVATWSSWRLVSTRFDVSRPTHTRGTWIMCDECRAEDERLDRSRESPAYEVRDIYLPLLHPSDPYARIAVEEMCYALAALGETVRSRNRYRGGEPIGYPASWNGVEE